MHEGDGLPGFPSVDVFIYLINPQLEKLRDPALELIQDTYQQLELIASQIVEKIFQRFPTLIPEIMEIIIKCISKERDHAREIVEAIIDSEQNYLFTNDLDYKENKSTTILPDDNNGEDERDGRGSGPGGHGGPGGPGGPPRRGEPPRPQGGNVFVRELRTRIDSYFSIVLRSVKDSVPKAIGYFLVRMSQDKLQFELYNAVNSNTALTASLGEPTRITERRKMLQGILSTLNKSLKVLQRDPE